MRNLYRGLSMEPAGDCGQSRAKNGAAQRAPAEPKQHLGSFRDELNGVDRKFKFRHVLYSIGLRVNALGCDGQ